MPPSAGAGPSGGAGGAGVHFGSDQPGRFIPFTVTGGNFQAEGDAGAGAGTGAIAAVDCVLCTPTGAVEDQVSSRSAKDFVLCAGAIAAVDCVLCTPARKARAEKLMRTHTPEDKPCTLKEVLCSRCVCCTAAKKRKLPSMQSATTGL